MLMKIWKYLILYQWGLVINSDSLYIPIYHTVKIVILKFKNIQTKYPENVHLLIILLVKTISELIDTQNLIYICHIWITDYLKDAIQFAEVILCVILCSLIWYAKKLEIYQMEHKSVFIDTQLLTSNIIIIIILVKVNWY